MFNVCTGLIKDGEIMDIEKFETIETFYRGLYRILQEPADGLNGNNYHYTVQRWNDATGWTHLTGGHNYGYQRILCNRIIRQDEYGEILV